MSQTIRDVSRKIQLIQMLIGTAVSQSVYAAAKLGIADFLDDSPKSYEELARETATHPRSLYRLLRALASVGIFAETEHGYFTITPLAYYLKSNIPDSLRAAAMMNGEEHHQVWGNIIYSLQTGESSFEHLYGMNMFEYYAQNPEPAKIFDQAMTSYSTIQDPGIISAYDFSDIKTIVDIAGGNGRLLIDILLANPHLQGILFDQHSVISRALPLIDSVGLQNRCQIATGDFFDFVPAGGDVYMLKFIIHDWDDVRAIKILQSCRKVIPKHGKLLIFEYIIPPGNEPFPGKFLDLHMLLACPGGSERTELEYKYLIEEAGFKLNRIILTESFMSIIECLPVE